MDLSRGIKPRPAMKPPKRVRTADQLSRGCTHRRDRHRDPAFEVKLCAACRTQQVVYKSSRSKRRGARCIGDRVGVLPNGSMHPDVPASTFVVVKLTGGLRTTSSPPVLPESQAVRRGVPPYSETRGTCPRMACAGPQPTGRRAIPEKPMTQTHELGRVSSKHPRRRLGNQASQTSPRLVWDAWWVSRL